MVVVIGLVLVVVLLYGIRLLNRLGPRSTSNARTRRGRQRVAQAAAIERSTASRQALVDWAEAPSTDPRLLGVTFGKDAEDTEPGVWVASVTDRSPAHRVGLRPGVRLLSIDGRTVDSPDAAASIVEAHRAGLPLELGWTADGAPHRETVIL